MVIALESELQNVLYNLSYGKLETAIDAIKRVSQKYLAIASDGNQSIAPTFKRFIGEIEYLFLKSVEIEYEYYIQRERMKEEQRAIREQMKQEALERKIIEQEQQQIEQEELKYKKEKESIEQRLSEVDEGKRAELLERIAQLELQMAEVTVKKETIIRLSHGQAGYVYVISNLGAFGDDIFKIGMTRRLEPQDRINELSGASVPFPFDVHSLIFSDDAVGLENAIHKEFSAKRLNKINLRKEFFKVSVDELENFVFKSHPSANFTRTMLAQQYYQSVSIDGAPPETLADYDEEEEAV
jgi:hypothetical protein